MTRYLFVFAFLLSPLSAFCQYSIIFHIRDSISHEPVIGARISISQTEKGAISNDEGVAKATGLAEGAFVAIVSASGYEKKEVAFVIPSADGEVMIYLAPHESEGDEVIVEATRDNRTISTIPTRVEVLTEEIDEAAAMDPSKISHVITHSTGIQLQTTSATSNTANVRIQGLDGRYTQILKDGLPLYGGYSGSLSIMQIPPLDLKQIEYIKGSASTLYGGGAIGGLINLISKDPSKEETLLHMNYSSLGTTDLNAFYSRRDEKIGLTLLASQSLQQSYDADDDHFSDVPEVEKINFHPRLFYYPTEDVRIIAGAAFLLEDRTGGDMTAIDRDASDSLHFYREENNSTRINTQLAIDWKLSEVTTVYFKNGMSFFDRHLTVVPHRDSSEYRFGGKQRINFSELAFRYRSPQHLLIGGLNFTEDDFEETEVPLAARRDESHLVFGGFIQDTWSPADFFSTEVGFRGDYSQDDGFFFLPRVSMLFKFSSELSSRLGGGLGYRLPSMFNQEAELLGYRDVAPVTFNGLDAERAVGLNVDINYKTLFSESVGWSINQLFFFTRLNSPLVLQPVSSSSNYRYAFVNANGDTRTFGFETSTKLTFWDFTLFIGYTYTDAQNHFDGKQTEMTLTPKHSLKGDLLFVIPGVWRIGWDYEFKGSQMLSDGRKTRDLFTTGVVIERTIEPFVLFLNLENITDVRQTRYESLLTAPNNTPQFTEVWAPLDGFFINGGIKVTL